MLLAGLTGGIGSGKTAVSGLLARHGAKIVDADVVAREVVEPESLGLELVLAEFGHSFALPGGQLDRRKLGSLVFSNPEALAKLNAIVHPLIRKSIQDTVDTFRKTDLVVVQVVPLLVESGQYQSEVVIVVDCEVEVAVSRLMQTRGLTEAESRARVASQIDRQVRLQAADLVIDNSGTRAHLAEEVDRCWAQLQGRTGR